MIMKLGSFEWGIKTSGQLNSLDKLNLSLKALGLRLNRKFKKQATTAEFDVSSIQLPDSKIVKETLEYINDVHQIPIRHHCLRTFLIGEYFGATEELSFDKELYAISALLHDVGLEEQYCCMHEGIDCFAVEGAKVAGEFLRKFDFNEKKVAIVEDAISFHLNVNIDKPITEAYLLNKASATDTIGLYRYQIHDHTAQQIGDRYPRHGFNEEVHTLLKHQCRIRPKSRIAFLYSNGFGGMLKENRFEKKVLL